MDEKDSNVGIHTNLAILVRVQTSAQILG